MRTTLLLLSVGLLGSVLPSLHAAQPAPPSDEPGRHDRIYYFEHRLLPKWTHQSEGAFYADLNAGALESLRDAATKIVDAGFAEKLVVHPSGEPKGVVIAFAPPAESPECFFVFITPAGDSFRYITAEKSADILNEGLKTCGGEWSVEGKHLTFGGLKEES